MARDRVPSAASRSLYPPGRLTRRLTARHPAFPWLETGLTSNRASQTLCTLDGCLHSDAFGCISMEMSIILIVWLVPSFRARASVFRHDVPPTRPYHSKEIPEFLASGQFKSPALSTPGIILESVAYRSRKSNDIAILISEPGYPASILRSSVRKTIHRQIQIANIRG